MPRALAFVTPPKIRRCVGKARMVVPSSCNPTQALTHRASMSSWFTLGCHCEHEDSSQQSCRLGNGVRIDWGCRHLHCHRAPIWPTRPIRSAGPNATHQQLSKSRAMLQPKLGQRMMPRRYA